MKSKIIFKLLFIIVALVVILNFGYITGEDKKYKDYSALDNGTYTDYTISIYNKTQFIAQSFMDNIFNAKYQEAYDLLDDNTKMQLFNNRVELFKNVMMEKVYNSEKGKKQYDLEMKENKSIYMNEDIHAFYEIYVYSPDSYSMQHNTAIDLNDNYYSDRDLLVDVIDTEPYTFKISLAIQEY